MKTLLFTLEYPPFYGGVANYYGNLVKYWGEPDNIFILNNNNNELINNKLPLLKWLPAIIALKKTIKKNNISQIIVGQILPLGIAAWICSRFSKNKYSVILHGMDFSFAIKSKRKKMLTKLILNSADKIIVTNSYTAELVKNFLASAADKITVVNPGVDEINHELPAATRQLLKDKYKLENKIILLSVGRLVKRKGFGQVIMALPTILEKIPNLIYVIIGNGDELKNYQTNNTIIISDASDEERNAWYNLSDIFIMPSRNIDGDYEGFGIVYLEANLAGKPVIAGRSGGVSDAVIDGFNGLLVEPENVKEISQAVITLSRDTDLRHKLGEQGRNRAIKDFGWEKQINKIYKTLN